LRKLTDEMKSDTFGQFSAQGVRAMRDMDRDMDVATCTTRIHQEFEHRWSDLSHRLKIIPGKDLLAKLNTHLQETCSVSLTPTAILAALTVSEVSADMRALIDGLERFISIAPPGS